jgi:hypothetical protein
LKLSQPFLSEIYCLTVMIASIFLRISSAIFIASIFLSFTFFQYGQNLSKCEIKSLSKLSFDAKLGWLLMFICGSRYTVNKNWSLLKRFIETRNFFIHYKPVTWEQRNEHSNLLNKKSLTHFWMQIWS